MRTCDANAFEYLSASSPRKSIRALKLDAKSPPSTRHSLILAADCNWGGQGRRDHVENVRAERVAGRKHTIAVPPSCWCGCVTTSKPRSNLDRVEKRPRSGGWRLRFANRAVRSVTSELAWLVRFPVRALRYKCAGRYPLNRDAERGSAALYGQLELQLVRAAPETQSFRIPGRETATRICPECRCPTESEYRQGNDSDHL
jgi:hypothetical protein